MNSQVYQTLCQRCDSLDLDKIFAGNYETPQIVTNLGDMPHDMLSSECPLCRLLAEAVHRPFSDESLASYHDTCYFCNNVDTEASFVQGYTLFADRVSSVRWEGIGHSKVTSYLGNVLGTTIHNDGLFIKSDVKNANAAAAATPSNGPCSPATADMDVPGYGLIALKVGRMKEGRSIQAVSCHPSSTGSCCDPSCEPVKILTRAAFTIVAAAGHDSAFGLPGVSTRKRQTQAHASIGGRLLVSVIEPYSNDSKTIKWNTRAWTYQEGVFSVRQLMFGTHQVTFRCADSQKCEGLTHPSEVNTSSLRLYGLRSRSAWEHITHYSKRHLTYESDALKAITATLNDYNDKTKDAAFHAWGMPFAANLNVLDGSSPGPLTGAIFASAQAIFGYSLAWYPASDNLERRHGFPTWSWSSSRANVGFLNLPYSTPDNALMPDPEINVHFEYLDGQIISLSEYMSQKPSVQLSHYLHLEAWSVRSNLTFHPDEGRVTIYVGDEKYHLAGNIDLESLPDGDDHKLIHDLMMAKDGWEAMVVFFSPENNEGAVQPFIITLMRVEDPEKPDEEVYERIGHVSGLRLKKMPQRRDRMDEAPGKDVLDRDIQNRDVNDSRRTVGWAAKVLDDQARETQEAEEKFRKFREGLKQAGRT
ncbi:C6 transcription factor [Colletotrichum kahawae]|uniref:C6 transcription factor n=1 Tax=Colletotrichum kahawae TaxID=34407 RepID=A0AAD9YBR9_COLKA|nr:C6 transcription factor [Colletotrichum kahawae]